MVVGNYISHHWELSSGLHGCCETGMHHCNQLRSYGHTDSLMIHTLVTHSFALSIDPQVSGPIATATLAAAVQSSVSSGKTMLVFSYIDRLAFVTLSFSLSLSLSLSPSLSLSLTIYVSCLSRAFSFCLPLSLSLCFFFRALPLYIFIFCFDSPSRPLRVPGSWRQTRSFAQMLISRLRRFQRTG